jgi:hypothetical protein
MQFSNLRGIWGKSAEGSPDESVGDGRPNHQRRSCSVRI